MSAQESAEQAPGDAGPKEKEVDIERLVELVYRLMLAELRLVRSRSGMDW